MPPANVAANAAAPISISPTFSDRFIIAPCAGTVGPAEASEAERPKNQVRTCWWNSGVALTRHSACQLPPECPPPECPPLDTAWPVAPKPPREADDPELVAVLDPLRPVE